MRPDDRATSLPLTAEAPLESLVARAFAGVEQVNAQFCFELDCVGVATPIALDAALGKHLTVTLAAGTVTRAVDGLCERIRAWPGEFGGTRYAITLRPWTWWLGLASDNRIFQNQSVPDIVEAVLRAHGYRDYELKLTGSYPLRDYCVQYGETDLAFICRLLESEGIFYFFRHEPGRHVLMLADSERAFPPCPGPATIPYVAAETGVRELQAIRQAQLQRQAVPGAYRSADYQFDMPATSLYAEVKADGNAPARYDYPGGHGARAAGDALVRRRLQGLQAPGLQLCGDSDSRQLVPGHRFTLSDHGLREANIAWTVAEVRHDATHERYRNHFLAFPAETPYRAPRPASAPRMPGAQTALVVGKAGEEIWTDQYGRIKVQFHWDRQGKRDENSSCWVRVAQSWAGKGWGAQFIPRVGQEVVVSFLEGDPDRPLVTGCVYNGANLPPYALPARATRSALRSQSSKGGGNNEISFEDSKDAEELYLRAQKDMKTDVLHDALRTVGNDDTLQVRRHRRISIAEGNDDLTVARGDRSAKVAEGRDSLAVKGARSVTVAGNESHDNKADFHHAVDGNYMLKVSGSLTIEAGGAITIKAGSSFSSEAGAGWSSKAGTSISNKAGTTLSNEAGVSLSSKAGASQTVDGGGLLTLKAGLIKVN